MSNITQIRLSGTTYDIIDATAIHSLDGYYTTGETNAAITAATNALAESIAEQGYQTSGDVQNAITAATNPINNALTAHTANTDIHVTVADKTAWNAKLDAADVEGFFGAVNYDSTSKRINFYNTSTGGTVLGYVDATDFIKDGMVSNVEIKEVTGKGTCLVITFNSDSGKQAIEIPISQIFDASNYYTKTEIDNIVTAAISGKQDTMSAGTSINITDNVISLVADNALSKTSTNPVVNSAITDAVIVEGTQGSVDGHLGKNSTITKNFTYDENVYMFRTYKGGSYESYTENFQMILTNSSGGTQTYTNPEQTFSDDKVDFVVDSKHYFSATTKDDWYITKITFKETENPNGINWEYKWNRNGYPEMDAATAIHDYIYPELSGKQDALVSGTNIKSINGNSLLGSGDLTVDTGLHAEVSGTTLVFS